MWQMGIGIRSKVVRRKKVFTFKSPFTLHTVPKHQPVKATVPSLPLVQAPRPQAEIRHIQSRVLERRKKDSVLVNVVFSWRAATGVDLHPTLPLQDIHLAASPPLTNPGDNKKPGLQRSYPSCAGVAPRAVRGAGSAPCPTVASDPVRGHATRHTVRCNAHGSDRKVRAHVLSDLSQPKHQTESPRSPMAVA